MIVASQQFKVPTIMAEVAETLNMTDASAPWLMSIFTLVGIFLAIPTGGLVQNIGPKKMIVVATIVAAIGSLIGAFAMNGGLMIFSRGIEGIGFVFMSVAAPIAISRFIKPSKIGLAMGIWAVWVPVSQILAFNSTPVMYESVGLKGIWIVFGSLALVLALVMQLAIDASKGNAVGTVKSKVKISAVLSKKNLWYISIVFCIFNLILLAIVTYVPTFLESSGLMNKSAAAFMATIPNILTIFCSPLIGKLSDKIGSRKKILLVTVSALIPAGVLMFSSNLVLFFAGAILLGVIGSGTPAMVLSSVGEAVENPELEGVGMGILIGFQSLGMFLGTLIFIPIVNMLGGSFIMGGLALVPIGVVGLVCVMLAQLK